MFAVLVWTILTIAGLVLILFVGFTNTFGPIAEAREYPVLNVVVTGIVGFLLYWWVGSSVDYIFAWKVMAVLAGVTILVDFITAVGARVNIVIPGLTLLLSPISIWAMIQFWQAV